MESGSEEILGARKRTRTSTPLRELGPEPSASANSAIRALGELYRKSELEQRQGQRVSAGSAAGYVA